MTRPHLFLIFFCWVEFIIGQIHLQAIVGILYCRKITMGMSQVSLPLYHSHSWCSLLKGSVPPVWRVPHAHVLKIGVASSVLLCKRWCCPAPAWIFYIMVAKGKPQNEDHSDHSHSLLRSQILAFDSCPNMVPCFHMHSIVWHDNDMAWRSRSLLSWCLLACWQGLCP